MNVYRVYVETEKVDEGWTLGAGSAVAAIGKAIRWSKASNAKRLTATCQILAKNISYKEWKEKEQP